MGRLTLIGWNEVELKAAAERLERAGHDVRRLMPRGDDALAALRRDPPQAFVIDLTRLPAQGRDLGIWLRRQKSTRSVPLVFVEGPVAATEKARGLLPDATFAPWRKIRGALGRALRNPPHDPVVPGLMAGYSGTPLPRKLGIKPGQVVGLLGAPDGFQARIEPLPASIRLVHRARGSLDLILLFAPRRAALARRFPGALKALADGGTMWLIWPKKASGMPTDLTQDDIRRYGLDRGLVDFKICAVDSTWSGLRFARRSIKRNS